MTSNIKTIHSNISMFKKIINWLFNKTSIKCSNCNRVINLNKKFINKLNFCNKECSYNYYKFGLITSIKDNDNNNDDEKDTLL